MEWKVAPSYANYTVVSVDENAKKAVVECQCDRCGGSEHVLAVAAQASSARE